MGTMNARKTNGNSESIPETRAQKPGRSIAVLSAVFKTAPLPRAPAECALQAHRPARVQPTRTAERVAQSNASATRGWPSAGPRRRGVGQGKEQPWSPSQPAARARGQRPRAPWGRLYPACVLLQCHSHIIPILSIYIALKSTLKRHFVFFPTGDTS